MIIEKIKGHLRYHHNDIWIEILNVLGGTQ